MRKEHGYYKCTLRIIAQGCGCSYNKLNIIDKSSHHQILVAHELHQVDISLEPTYNGICKSISSIYKQSRARELCNPYPF